MSVIGYIRVSTVEQNSDRQKESIGEVDELFEGMRSIGQHTCIWNATAFVSGTYIVHLATQKDVRVSKIMLLK